MASMTEVRTPTKDTAADPAAVPPTTIASEADKDPIRATGTDALVPESRPEVANGANGSVTAGVPATEPNVAGDTVPKGASVVESQPINEGILNYKGPGLVKSLIFQKKFFWFSDEPLEHKHLSSYLSNEKPDVSHRNAAHATQTGKGLLFFAKRAEDKHHPAGILNLGEMSDFVKGDFLDFSFKIHGHKHTFQALTRAEHAGWLVAIETRSSEAKEAHEGLVGSEGYKSQLDKLAKPTGATSSIGASRSASRPKKNTESKPVDSKVTEPKTNDSAMAATAGGTTTTAVAAGGATRSGSSSDEAKPKSKSKSRSESRKRSSIFGGLLGKKEDHDEKKELKKEEREEKKEIKKEQKEEKAERKVEEQAVKHDLQEENKAEKAAEKEELKLEQNEQTKPGAGTSGHIDAAAIAARVVSAPLATEGEIAPTTTGTTTGTTEKPTVVTGETAQPSAVESAAGTTSRDTAPKANKRGSIFGNFFNKKDVSSPTSEIAPAVPAKDEASLTSSTAPKVEDPVSAPSAMTTTATTEPSATAANDAVASPVASPNTPDATKPQRRTSFFNNLGTKKDRRSEAMSDAEGTDAEGKKTTASKLGGLFRKPSRATPTTSTKAEPTTPGKTLNETTEAPAPIGMDAPSTTNGNDIAPVTAHKTETQQTPVQASA